MSGGRISGVFATLLVVGLGAARAVAADAAQGASSPTTRPATGPATQSVLTVGEELQRLETEQARLALDQAKTNMDKAEGELEDVRALFKEKLVTIESLNQATRSYEEAVLAYRQAQIELKKKKLEFLKNATLLTVVDAKKVPREGDEFACITLRNDSDLNKARIAMGEDEDLSRERLASLLKVDNVIVTLREDSGVIIGDPYQQIVRELRHGQEVQLEYRLLKKDIEHVTVSLEFLGETKDYDVFLKKESQQELPVITAGQYAQIGQLGEKIKYDLELKCISNTERAFRLLVLGLPREIRFAICDTASQAMITEVRFNEELSKQKLYVEASIPDTLDPNLVDTNITFYFLATPQSELGKIHEAIQARGGGNLPPEEFEKFKARKVDLTLTPRGVGKLEIRATNAFCEAKKGEPVRIKCSLVNTGTLVLQGVTPTLDLPLEWEGELTPARIDLIHGKEKVLLKGTITPSADVDVGEYKITVLAEGRSGIDVVESEPKDFTVRIAAESSITGTVILVAVLIVLVVGIAIASIKISRR